jgi:hypothetical protein
VACEFRVGVVVSCALRDAAPMRPVSVPVSNLIFLGMWLSPGGLGLARGVQPRILVTDTAAPIVSDCLFENGESGWWFTNNTTHHRNYLTSNKSIHIPGL